MHVIARTIVYRSDDLAKLWLYRIHSSVATPFGLGFWFWQKQKVSKISILITVCT